MALSTAGAEPTSVTVSTRSSTGLWSAGDAAPEPVRGFATLEVRDWVSDARNLGDDGVLSVRVDRGPDTWVVQVARPGWAVDRLPRRAGPESASGGVVLGAGVHDRTGRGDPNLPQAPAVAWMWGFGAVLKNGALLADFVPVEAWAVDSTTMRGKTLPELHVLVRELPDLHTLHLAFRDVLLMVDGEVQASAAVAARGLQPTPGGAATGTGGAGAAGAGAPPARQKVDGVGLPGLTPAPQVPSGRAPPKTTGTGLAATN